MDLAGMKTLKFDETDDALIFSLPLGISCPYAGACKSFVLRATAEVVHLPQTSNTKEEPHLCPAVEIESDKENRKRHWYNWDLIREVLYTSEDQTLALKELIELSLQMRPPKSKVIIHRAGDFWIETYMKAWLLVACDRQSQEFHASTKSLSMWWNLQHLVPQNFHLCATYGGTLDSLIDLYPHVFHTTQRLTVA